ncbi:hypothetical protein PaG_05411 [Moesziomyces aphidis]|uniref:Uncharacterized protein n=1 Tax=Moesziomyces aphidis TaxID=84754 RepID=W3VGA6_MOEAP|nr:hypothetical protein PaG_05411 [Moesziomyces aphidis]
MSALHAAVGGHAGKPHLPYRDLHNVGTTAPTKTPDITMDMAGRRHEAHLSTEVLRPSLLIVTGEERWDGSRSASLFAVLHSALPCKPNRLGTIQPLPPQSAVGEPKCVDVDTEFGRLRVALTRPKHDEQETTLPPVPHPQRLSQKLGWKHKASPEPEEATGSAEAALKAERRQNRNACEVSGYHFGSTMAATAAPPHVTLHGSTSGDTRLHAMSTPVP